jgi:hypothetical protein
MDILQTPLPPRMAWTGAELRQTDDWITRLTRDELEELDRALQAVKRRGLDRSTLRPQDFPLPMLSDRLSWMDRELKTGRGFVLLRGLEVDRYSLEDLETLYWGLSIHLGRVISQDAKGTVIQHIADIGASNLDDPNLRLYVTAKGQPAHADMSDIVALLCVDRALEGGESVIVSTMAIYNRMLKEHPEYLEPLYAGFYHDLRGEGPTGRLDEVSDVPVPVFSNQGGVLRSWFHGRKIRHGAEKHGVPLTPLQKAAVDYVEALGYDPDMRLDMNLQPGDIQFLNNFVAMHYRTAFKDGGGHKRLMLRIWLEMNDMGPFDPALEKWVRTGVPSQEWAKDKALPSLGLV